MMIKNKNKTIKSMVAISLFSLSSLCAFSAFSQENINNTNNNFLGNRFEQRQEIIRKYGANQTLNISWYTNQRLEFREMLDKYLPVSNTLSNSVGANVIIIPDKSSSGAVSTALGSSTAAALISPLDMKALTDKGWTPVLSTNSASSAVLLGKKQSIKNPNEISKKNIMSNLSHNSKIMKFSLINSKLFNPNSFTEEYLTKEDLLSSLNDRGTDLIVLEENVAQDIIAKNPTKYEIVYNSKIELNNILLINPSYANLSNNIINSFLRLNNMNTKNKMEVFNTNGQIFKNIDQKELDLAKNIAEVK